MGLRGQRPQPTAIKELKGNPGKRPLNLLEPRPAGIAEPPECISPAALAIWREVKAAMPPALYTGADSHLLLAFCESAALHRRATAELEGGNLVVGDTRVNPLVRVQSEAARVMAAIGGRLGLSPADRTRLSCEQPNADQSSWTAFLASSSSSNGSRSRAVKVPAARSKFVAGNGKF